MNLVESIRLVMIISFKHGISRLLLVLLVVSIPVIYTFQVPHLNQTNIKFYIYLFKSSSPEYGSPKTLRIFLSEKNQSPESPHQSKIISESRIFLP